MSKRPEFVLLTAVALILAWPGITEAQLAPTGDHYGGRTSDTGFAAKVNAAGGYSASVPLELPTPRGSLPMPIQIVFGGHTVGAAGLGWDLPLSYLRVDVSVTKRKPVNAPNAPVQGRQRVSVSIAGSSMTLVPKGSAWVSQMENGLFSAAPSGANWIAYDGQGHTYTFTEPAGHTGAGLWLLTEISGAAGTMMKLDYDVGTVALTGGSAMSVDLKRVSYNFNPALGCSKDVLELSYGSDSPKPLSISVMPKVVVRKHTLESIDVRMRSSCSSTLSVRRYAFSYLPDPDTDLPRLDNVKLYGRQGTAEETTALPVATYRYGSASSGGVLSFVDNAALVVPTGNELDSSQITSSSNVSVSLPGSGESYATYQSFTDVTGDGRTDLVFSNQGTVWFEKNRPANGGSSSLAAPAVLGDSSTLIHGPVSSNTLTKTRFQFHNQDLTANTSNTWRQFIDVNGDGRVDIIDASEHADVWTVYLNTPGNGASGVEWRERIIPITQIRNRLEEYGHTFEDSDHLPLLRKYTAKEYVTSGDTGDLIEVKGEYTYTEWELKDVNGDGLPDFVFNALPVQMREAVQTLPYPGGGTYELIHHLPLPGPGTNSILAMFDVSAVTLDSFGATPYRELFSDPVLLRENTACGVELWQEVDYDTHFSNGTNQLLRCTLADVTGDGIVDRIDHATAFIGLGTAFSQIQIPMPVGTDGPIDYVGKHHSGQQVQCFGADPADYFESVITGGLRDITGDGIADLR
jgi:hypothetical protein